MYILLRHAEKMPGPDPGLTSVGRERARFLARMLSESTILSIYSTAYKRTQETAEPLSDATGQVAIEYDRNDIDAFASSLASVDGVKCIIGHSKSTLELLKKLTGLDGNPILEDSEFDRMYIFDLPLTSIDSVLQIRYGND